MIGAVAILTAAMVIPDDAVPTCLRVTELQPRAGGGAIAVEGELLRWSADAGDTLQLMVAVEQPGMYAIAVRTAHGDDGSLIAARLWDDAFASGEPVAVGPGRHVLELSLAETGTIRLDCVDLRRTGDVVPPRTRGAGRPFLGVEMGGDESGVAITRTVDGSAAAEAGLRAGDVIVRIDGEPMESANGVAAAIGRHDAGDTIELDLRRDGEPLHVVVTLGRRPARRDDARAGHVVEVLDVQPGQVIADIGCGSGWLSEAIAARLGPDGLVYAVEIQERLVRALRRGVASNVVPVYSVADDVLLPDDSLDTAMLHDVAAHVDEPGRPRFYASVARALRPGGRLVIFDPHGKARAMLDELAGYGFTPVEAVGHREPDDLDRLLQGGIVFRYRR